jgi:hypothetical protein
MISLSSIYSNAWYLLFATNGQTISSVRLPLTVSVSRIRVLGLTMCLVPGMVYPASVWYSPTVSKGFRNLTRTTVVFKEAGMHFGEACRSNALFFGHLRSIPDKIVRQSSIENNPRFDVVSIIS